MYTSIEYLLSSLAIRMNCVFLYYVGHVILFIMGTRFGYVPMWLCGFVAMYLCIYVAIWLCGYVPMWVTHGCIMEYFLTLFGNMF